MAAGKPPFEDAYGSIIVMVCGLLRLVQEFPVKRCYEEFEFDNVGAARDCQDPGHFRRKAQLRAGLDSVMYSPRRMAPDFQVPVDGR